MHNINVKDEYIKLAMRTASDDTLPAAMRLSGSHQVIQLVHAAMGLATESGEFMDAFKRFAFYGQEMDAVNLVEELGDILWYVALAADALGVSFAEIQARNIAKLRKRYPKKFSQKDAANRDLQSERKALASRPAGLDGRAS